MHHGGKLEKAPPDLVEQFTGTVSSMPGASVRKMFGNPAGFANGHLFTGLFGFGWFVRLADADREELAAAGGTPFEPMPGRPMRDYLLLPPPIIEDPAAVAPWLTRALEHVQQLPPKTKR